MSRPSRSIKDVWVVMSRQLTQAQLQHTPLSQGHLQYRPGCTTLCGLLINSFSSVIKFFFQYFSIDDTHFRYESFIKIIRTFVEFQTDCRPGAEEGLALAHIQGTRALIFSSCALFNYTLSSRTGSALVWHSEGRRF